MRSKFLVALAILCGTLYAQDSIFDQPHIYKKETIRWYQGPSNWTYWPPNRPEKFDPDGMTYASSTDEYNTIATVLWHGHHVEVRCNDKGPNPIELTRGAFKQLEPLATGVLKGAIVYRHSLIDTPKDKDDYADQHTTGRTDNGQTGTRS